MSGGRRLLHHGIDRLNPCPGAGVRLHERNPADRIGFWITLPGQVI